MAKEISELTGKTTPVGTDEIEIQETGGGTSKKATLANVWANIDSEVNSSAEITVTGAASVAETGEGKIGATATNGGGVIGYGSTYDSFLGSRGGGVAVGVLANSLNVVLAGSATVSNVLNLKPVAVTIASGAITRTASVHVVDTEGGAGTDDLHTISGGVEGDILVLYSSVAARDTTVKDQTTLGSGNINLAGGADFSLSHPYDKLVLIFRAVQWDELTRSNNL